MADTSGYFNKQSYERGALCVVRSMSVMNMTREQLIAFIGELDAFQEELARHMDTGHGLQER